MKSYRCSNVLRCTLIRAEIHPWMKSQLRVITGQVVWRGGGIMLEVSWASDKSRGGVSVLVELFRTTFVFRINSSGYFNSTGQIIGQTVRRGGGSMFGMLEGCGEGMGIVFVFGDPF